MATIGCPDKISFDITLSAQLGVTPAKEIARIAKYVSSGKKLPLTIGSHVYGQYRWAILSYSVKAQTFDKYGNLYVAVLSVSLQEYLRR